MDSRDSFKDQKRRGDTAPDLKKQLRLKDRIIEDLKFQLRDTHRQLRRKEREICEKNRIIQNIYSSKTWKLVRLYDKFSRAISFSTKKTIRPQTQQITEERNDNKLTTAISEAKLRELDDFLRKNKDNGKNFVIIAAEYRYQEFVLMQRDNLNHRSIGLAEGLAKDNNRVLFAHIDNSFTEGAMDYGETRENIFLMHIDLLSRLMDYIFERLSDKDMPKVMIIEGLLPSLVELLSYANAHGWITIYDIVKNWEEFYLEGGQRTCNKNIEDYMARNADILTVANDTLVDKFGRFGTVEVIHNGYLPEQLMDIIGKYDNATKGLLA